MLEGVDELCRGAPLVAAIAEHKKLRELDIWYGNPSAGVAVLDGLGDLESLGHIGIATGDFRGSLGRTLEHFPLLSSLALGRSDFHTIRSVSEKASITVLRIQGATFGDPGLMLLAGMPNLEEAWIEMSEGECEDEVTASGVERLASSLKRLDMLNLPDSFPVDSVKPTSGVRVNLECR